MTAPISVHVVCGARCKAQVGRVEIDGGEHRYRSDAPITEDYIIAGDGWEKLVAHVRHLKKLGRTAPKLRMLTDLPLEVPDEDHGDAFPGFCYEGHARMTVSRRDLVAAVAAYEDRGGVPQEVVVRR